MSPFETPEQSLAGLDTKAVASLVAAATDVVLVIDRAGVIRDVAVGGDELSLGEYRKWVGRVWIDTVAADSRSRVKALLSGAATGTLCRWRQVERLCIEAALELTRDNRASAAELLGLSRQSRYVRLRRYGVGDSGGDGEN